jgi:hypothetical protein
MGYEIFAGTPKTDGSAIDRVIAEATRRREHVWIMTAAWRVDPAKGGRAVMDHENLISLGGPGCLVCENTYTPELAAKRCEGGPG